MAWYFNNCESSPCSPGQEVGSWEGTCLDGAPSALLNSLPTRVKSYLLDNATGCCPLSPSGMTYARSTETHGGEAWTWFPEASLARIYPLLERVMDWTVSGQDFGPKWPGSSARFNLATCSWRTAQCSLLGGLTEFSETWPRWGMMRSGELLVRMTPAHLTNVSGSGYWPTPLANSGTGAGHQGRTGGLNLQTAVANTPSGAWPTPTCADAFTDKLKSSQQKEGSMHSVNLSQAVKMWPTPIASDYNTRRRTAAWRGNDLVSQVTEAEEAAGNEQPKSGGQLNPDWVEWLMGWPIGWTDLKELVTDRFHTWPHWHGVPSTNASPSTEAA